AKDSKRRKGLTRLFVRFRTLTIKFVKIPAGSRKLAHSTSNWEAAFIRISGFPLYISIRPVILTCFPSIPESSGEFDTGDAGEMQPVKVLVGITGADIQKRVAAF